MATLLHIPTLRVHRSVSPPDLIPGVEKPYPPTFGDWLINPDLSAVEGVPQEHWRVDGLAVREATQVEKDDAAAQLANEIEAANRQAAAELVASNEPLVRVIRMLAKMTAEEIRAMKPGGGGPLPTQTDAELAQAMVQRLLNGEGAV